MSTTKPLAGSVGGDSRPTDPAHAGQGQGKLLEVYRPVWTPDDDPLLFETYAPYDDVTTSAGQLWRG